ncbi:hypothetical protein [Spiroplasma sp. DGKH1]|uniref:hypothetical protein n=1 Tax=Spiroplasma sp. DGKH1 TaxID=3050074 RepID=UPI0034C5E715
MKKILCSLLSLTLVTLPSLAVVACGNKLSYHRLAKDLTQWDLSYDKGIFNNSLTQATVNKYSDVSLAQAFFLFNPQQVLEECYGSASADPTSDNCYLPLATFTKDVLYQYELKTTSDLQNSLVYVDDNSRPDQTKSFQKMDNDLSFQYQVDKNSLKAGDDPANPQWVHIADNEQNTPGSFSLRINFNIKISARDNNPDGYQKSKQGTVVMIYSFGL